MARTGPAYKRHTPQSSGKAPESHRLIDSNLQYLGAHADIPPRRKASIATAADMRIARSCSTRQAMLAAMREFSPNPNATRPIEQLQQASRSAIAVFVASSEDPHLCRFV
jgi:hypothetical protein